MSREHRYLIAKNLFDRYTVLVGVTTKTTSVYCDECRQWVAEYEGDQISRHTKAQFLEKIVDDHEKQLIGHKVEFEPKDLSSWHE